MGFSLEQAVAVVTGANRGIGKTLSEALLQQGIVKLYAAVRSPTSMAEMQQVYGERVVPLELDLTRPGTIGDAARIASDATLVINNAGVLRTSGALAEDAIDSLKFEMETNCYGLIRVAQAFAPVLKRNGGGVLVQVNSIVSMKCFPQFATYCASKAAAYSITQALRADLAEQGTRVISVHPGPIATDMGATAGLTDIAVPADCVATSLLEALASDQVHAFPDPMAKQLESAYQSFAKQVIE